MILRIAVIISLFCFCSFAENESLNDAIKDAISNRHVAVFSWIANLVKLLHQIL
jgi:hypothetical protein